MAYKFLSLAIVLLAVPLAESIYNRKQFKELVMKDNSNDDAILMTAQELLTRSGFFFEEHYVLAEDGYITQLVRIINPLVARENLRKPPVMLYHGGNIDMTCYLIASSKQHHPEAWPRQEARTSSQRSLGFALANEGFDVWLIGTRGSNYANQAFTLDPYVIELTKSGNWDYMNYKPLYQYAKTKKYWQYGLDDIIAKEIGPQIDKVKAVTGSQEVSIFSFSLSTPTTLAFLAENPDYAKNVKAFIQMAPTVAADHFSFLDKFYFEKICPKLPTRGIGFTPTFALTPFVRKILLEMSKSPELRYSLIYNLITGLFGPSPKYQTNLERNILGHVFQPVSFKSVQGYCQSSTSKKLIKFDYKKKGNLEHYNQPDPPAYDISKLQVQHWAIISGGFDGLADPTTIERIKAVVHTPSPVEHIVAPAFNHLDLIAAQEVDIYVNQPVINILERVSSN